MDNERPPLFPIGSSGSAPSLFPIIERVSDQPSNVQESLTWLSNASFSESLIPAPEPVPEWYLREIDKEDEVEIEDVAGRSSNLLIPSPSKEEDTDDFESLLVEKGDGEKKKRKERSHKSKGKKEKKRKASGNMDVSMRNQGKARWVDIERKDYQFDARGDRDNLVYDSLYRMDVPRFYRYQIKLLQSNIEKPFSSFPGLHGDEDGAVMDEKTRSECRYWSAKHAALERSKDFKRLQIIRPSKSKTKKSFNYPFGEFISLEEFGDESEPDCIVREESWENYVTRKTKEFNQLTRERPQDESLWITFVNFQDELIKAASKKAAVQQAIEKKIAVLEKALEIHLFSEDLWLLFLETSRKRDPISILISKWENCLKQNPRSYKLWREYLHLRKGEFSLFTESSVRKEFIHAFHVYLAANNFKEFSKNNQDINEVEVEKNVVSLFIDLCLFEWQTGHHEFAIGLLQAQIEYSLFAPHIEVSEKSKKRLFKEFWDSGSPRIGENGSAGWAEWLQREEEYIRNAVTDVDKDMGDEEEKGGWSGWFEPDSKNVEIDNEPVPVIEDQVEDENEEVQEIKEDEKDEAILLEQLGLSIHPGEELEIKDPETWRCWSEEEQRRDSLQWLPVHSRNLKAAQDEEILPEAEGDEEQLERTVLFEDIQECLFSLKTADAQLELISYFTDFCAGPSLQWYCSNSAKWSQRIASLEDLPGSLLQQMGNANVLENLVGGREWIHENQERCKFVVTALLLLRPHFQHSLPLQEKLLDVEAAMNDGARILAKKLLKNDRQAVLLMGAYARAEASIGNIEVARKVFDATLASLNTMSKEAQQHAPILYECYAQLELSQIGSGDSTWSKQDLIYQKVLSMLSCLGSGMPYSPFKAGTQASSTQLLKARHGFKEHLQTTRTRRIQGELSDQIRSWISCAAIFEWLLDGFDAARLIFEDSFAIGLPGKRQESLQFELLYCQYIQMMEHHKKIIKPAVLRDAVLRGLTQYPSNPQLLNAYARFSSYVACTNNLRRFFDDLLQKRPSIIIWLFAISIELRKIGSESRIHSLFERALEKSNAQQSVLLWRCYISFELQVRGDKDAARRIYFRAIHACPWSKTLWLDGFKKMSAALSPKELSEFQDIMREKELQLRTDVYEILLAKEEAED